MDEWRRDTPERVDFHRTKYGPEILIDIAWIHDMPTFLIDRPHWLGFYDILLVTRGRGWFWLDGHRMRVSPGQVFFTSPGQVRDWDVSSIDGICLFFPATFLEEFFSDEQFLQRLPYFHAGSNAAALKLTPARALRMRRSLFHMRAELRTYRDDSPHLLRARLYETLVELARDYSRRYGAPASRTLHRAVVEFRRLVAQQALNRHEVSDYARDLAVSPSYLRALCRRHLGVPAKEVIQERLEVAARRKLLFSDVPAERIAAELGFRDPSYFARFFRRRTGVSPRRFRESVTRPTTAMTR
jgi:AraC-like DNA-binding protein